MAEVHLRRRHLVGLKQAKVAAQKVADDLAEEFGMAANWDGDVLRLSRSGTEGELMVTRNEVQFDLRLGVLLVPFRARIEERANATFDRHFS